MPEPRPSVSPLRVVALHDPAGIADRVATQPDLIVAHFVPIADLRRGTVAGYEVLLTVGGEVALAPHAWSAQAHVDAAPAIEAGLLGVALAQRERLAPDALLLVGLGAAGLRSVAVRDRLAAAGRLDGLVLSLAGPGPHEGPELRRTLDAARAAGARVAVDDVGSGATSLRQLLGLRPDLVRVGADLVTEVDRDPARAAVVEALGALASRLGARVIAAGIPGPPELAALRRMGVGLGQGPLVGGGAPATSPLAASVARAIRAATPPSAPGASVAALVEARPALEWGASLETIADAFLADPRHEVLVLVDERQRPLALVERAALLRGEPFERPVTRVTPSSPLKTVARRAAARPTLERYHPLAACDRHGVYLGLVRVESLLDALAAE